MSRNQAWEVKTINKMITDTFFKREEMPRLKRPKKRGDGEDG